jgi:antitoxin MazE
MYIYLLMNHLRLSKYGNSLAVRIPTEYVRQTGLKDGDELQVNVATDGSLCLSAKNWNRKTFALELIEHQAKIPMSPSIMDKLRNDARY